MVLERPGLRLLLNLAHGRAVGANLAADAAVVDLAIRAHAQTWKLLFA